MRAACTTECGHSPVVGGGFFSRALEFCPCGDSQVPRVPRLLNQLFLSLPSLQGTFSLPYPPQPVSTEIIQFYLIISHYFLLPLLFITFLSILDLIELID